MRLSTRGRFAISAMIDLALREENIPVSLATLALRHHISLSYLEQMFARLRKAGLVESTRGPGGGYSLGLRGDQISVADIIAAIEDDDPDSTNETDRGSAFDLTKDLWTNLQSALVRHMRTVSLRSLALEQKTKGFKPAERKNVKRPQLVTPRPTPVHTNAPNSVFSWTGVLPAAK